MACHPACTLHRSHKGSCYDSITGCDLGEADAHNKRVAFYQAELERAKSCLAKAKSKTIQILAKEGVRLAEIRLRGVEHGGY